MSYTTTYDYTATHRERSLPFAAVLRGVYLWMTLGLLLTGVTAYALAQNTALLYTFFSTPALMWGCLIGELVLVVVLSAAIHRLSYPVAALLFLLYALINGVTFASIFMIYTMQSIAQTFFICAGTFGVMSVVGFTVKRDLSAMGRILMMVLIGLIIATIVNIFLHSAGLALLLNYVGVILFVALTAYDTQKIKQMCAVAAETGENATVSKLALLGSLTLYLDFINLFLYLLRLFGDRK